MQVKDAAIFREKNLVFLNYLVTDTGFQDLWLCTWPVTIGLKDNEKYLLGLNKSVFEAYRVWMEVSIVY